MKTSIQRKRQQAFTLVELVVTISIIGVLSAIAVPRFIDLRTQAYNSSRDGSISAVRSGIMLVASKNQATGAVPGTTFPPNLEATWSGPGGTVATGGAVCGVPPCPCATANPCFELVLDSPVNDGQIAPDNRGWRQTAGGTYVFTNPAAAVDTTCTYSSATGQFTCS